MSRSLKHLAALLLASTLLLAACSSGAKEQPKEAGNTAAQTSSGPVKIKIFAQTAQWIGDLPTNTFTKFAEQKFNIQFEWQTVPFDGAAEKRQISLASGDYPDVYMLIAWVDRFSQTDLIRFGQQGVIIPLNDLIDKYAPNIKDAMAKYPDFRKLITAPDGKIYGLTQYNECYHCSYPNKFWMNSKWLKQLNLAPPKTTAEMKKVLEAFKAMNPNAVPLSGSTEEYGVHVIPFFMNGFIYDDDRTYLIVNNGKVELAATRPEWKEGLAYVKSLWDEGLIDKGAFTQNAEAYKKLGDNASAEILGGGTAMHPYIFVSPNNESSKDYDAIAPLTGPHAAYAAFNAPYESGATFVLTNKASKEAQIAAIKLVDYMFSQDGQIRASIGEEGLDWRKPQDGDVALEKGTKPVLATIPGKDGEKPHNSNWSSMGQYFQPKPFRDSWVSSTEVYKSEGYERRLQEATHLYDGKQPKDVFPHWAIWIDPSNADEMALLKKNIKDYVEENALQFVTGAKDLNKDWDAYVAGLEKLNLKRYLDVMQKGYDVYKK